MRAEIGTKGLKNSYQADFAEEAKCECGGTARIAFVADELGLAERICGLYENKGKGNFWPHDSIAVAVYFCKNCFKAVALWNQA